MMFDVLTTERLLLLPLSRDLLLQTVAAGEFEWQVYHFPQGWAGEAAVIFPIHLLNLGEEDVVAGSFAIVEAASGRAIGLLGTKHQPQRGQVEIGYGLTQESWGQGYATEAVGALLTHLHGWPNVRTVLAETLPSNWASRRVLEKTGFEQTGQRTDEADGELLRWAYAFPEMADSHQ